MALLFVLIAGSFVALSNFCMRRSVDRGGSSKAFLFLQMTIACLLSILLNPVRTGQYQINSSILGLGLLAGLIMAFMLYALGKAVEQGPPGLTFSIINAATVMPGVVMALVFGSAFGFIYTLWHGLGSMLVLIGLFWAGAGLSGIQDKKRWALFCLAMFSFHVLLLVLFQWRALVLNLPHPEEFVSFFTAEQIRSQWFTPAMYAASGAVQLLIFIQAEKRWPLWPEVGFGVLGGIANGMCTFFLVHATEVATCLENAIIFPIFSVVSIILTNLWGQVLYQEKVNWRACQVCVAGLILGTVDWSALARSCGL